MRYICPFLSILIFRAHFYDFFASRSLKPVQRYPLPAATTELEKTEVDVRHQLAEFARGLDAYKRLGLAFENVVGEAGTSNNIRVVFTLIHPTESTRRYCFDVHVSPTDDSYAVTACQPPVAALERLVSQLNATNQFSVFVQQMRAEFVAIARG